jgi:ferrochelatase
MYTAHSVPLAMASSSSYVQQLTEACRLVSDRLGRPDWKLAYQSRSGPPHQPWLEPDIGDALRAAAADPSSREIVIAPIGFLSDHMEVLYDLDTEARELCHQLGLNMVRAGTVGVHPKLVAMIVELIQERLGLAERRAIGRFGPEPDECAVDCCHPPSRPPHLQSQRK